MKNVKFCEEENQIVIDNGYDIITYKIFPKEYKFTVSSYNQNSDNRIYNYMIYNYKVHVNPIEIYSQLHEWKFNELLEDFEYKVKNSTILNFTEVNLLPSEKKYYNELKKQTDWSKVDLLLDFDVNTYILSLHDDLIPREHYLLFLRSNIERIKNGIKKVEELVKNQSVGLEISLNDDTKSIWYPNSESEKKEMYLYYDLPKEERVESDYAKKMKYAGDFLGSIFNSSSSTYVGISQYEFENSTKIVLHLQKILNEYTVTKK